MNPNNGGTRDDVVLGLWSPSLDSTLRASLRLSKIAPGDFVAMLTPTYRAFGFPLKLTRE